MNKDIAGRWVAALRSGEYQQGTTELENISFVDGKSTFCCLGVLSHIAYSEGVCDRSETDRGYARYTDTFEEWQSSILPVPVRIWSGMHDQYGTLIEGDSRSLTAMNDGGEEWDKEAHEYVMLGPLSFAEIADYIEANWEQL